MMRVRYIFLPVFLLASSPVLGVSGGNLDILPRGDYVCEWPAPSDSEDWRLRAPERDFSVTSGSRYETAEGIGTYLRTGDLVQFTSGPRKGERYAMKSENFLRHLGEDGSADGLRCVRRRLSDIED